MYTMKLIFRVGMAAVSHAAKISPPGHSCAGCSSSAISDLKSVINLTKDILAQYGVTDTKILKRVQNIPVSLRNNPDSWKTIMTFMIHHGFSAPSIVDMVVRHPALLQYSPQKIAFIWNVFQELFQRENTVKNLIYKHPHFLSLSRSDIVCRCEQLRGVTGSYKFSANVLLRCPQIMYQSLDELQEVSDYLSSVMVVRNAAEYYNSVALGCTIEEVKMRHVFLDRCGKYKTPNLKQSQSVSTGNPSLLEIFDTSDEEFATKVVGVTLEEFVVFQSMFDDERRKGSDSGLETDDDSDDD